MTPPRLLPSTLGRVLLTGALLLTPALAAPAAHAAVDTTTPVVAADFDDGQIPAGWTVGAGSGTWNVESGRLIGRSANSNQISTIAFGPHLEDYRFEATVRFETVVDANRWAALALDMPASGNPPWAQAAMRSNTVAANGTEFAQRTAAPAWNVTNAAAAPAAAGTGKDVKVAIEVHGNSADWFFNGSKVQSTTTLYRSDDGGLGLVANGGKIQFDDIKVTRLAPASLVLPNDDQATPKVVAHRGYSAVAPENTNVAMAIGAKAGADFVENDVSLNADGEPWVLHDSTVNRTSNGTGALTALTSSYLQTLDAGAWFSPAFANEPLPSLDSQLDQAKLGSAKLLLEIKAPETEAQVRTIIDHVRAKGMVRRVVIQSFDDDIVRWANAYEPNIPTMILRGGLDADPVATAKALGVVSYNPDASAIKGKPEVVKALNDAGIAVMPYTVDNPADWLALRDIGVDGIITNRAGELVGWNLRYGQGGVSKAATAEILAPANGTTLTRGERLSLALDLRDQTSVTATLDGQPIAPGATINPDLLPLGEHVVRVTAPGAKGEPATASSTFTVAPTSTGVAYLVAVMRGVPTDLRSALLPLAVEHRWASFRARLVAKQASLTEEVFARLDADAAALQASEGPGAPEEPVVGEKGDKGDKGDPGTPGTNGTNGADGKNGTNGANGADGHDGATGVSGPAGAKGIAGDKGNAGDKGASGDKGDQGPAGAAGAKGDKGDPGTTAVVTRSAALRCTIATRTIACKKASVSTRTSARLTRSGRTYAKGSLGRLVRTRRITKGSYTLRIGSGRHVAKHAVRFR